MPSNKSRCHIVLGDTRERQFQHMLKTPEGELRIYSSSRIRQTDKTSHRYKRYLDTLLFKDGRVTIIVEGLESSRAYNLFYRIYREIGSTCVLLGLDIQEEQGGEQKRYCKGIL
jgi:hypothetical protein